MRGKMQVINIATTNYLPTIQNLRKINSADTVGTFLLAFYMFAVIKPWRFNSITVWEDTVWLHFNNSEALGITYPNFSSITG